MTFLGMMPRVTDAVHDNHVMASSGYLFYGRRAAGIVAECIALGQLDPLFDAILLSTRTKRSVMLQRETANERPAI